MKWLGNSLRLGYHQRKKVLQEAGLVAVDTTGGYVVFGPVWRPQDLPEGDTVLYGSVLSEVLQRFWESEEPPTADRRKPEDDECELFYQYNTARCPSGRFEWPFNECRAPLGPPDRGLRVNVGQLVPKPNPAFLLERYSSLDKLLGVTGWIKRFVNNCRKPQAERNFAPVLSPAERNAALCSLVRVVQAEHFEEEVQPAYKGKGEMHLPQYYRPISLIPIVSKLFENLISTQIINHMVDNNFLNMNQYAYQRGRSTTDAARDVVTRVLGHLEGGRQVAGIFCDLSRAFEMVDHSLLLSKLWHMTVPLSPNVRNLGLNLDSSLSWIPQVAQHHTAPPTAALRVNLLPRELKLTCAPQARLSSGPEQKAKRGQPASSPETKQTFQLPEIREDTSAAGPSVDRLPAPAPSEARARSHSTPGLTTPAAPRIDISRASSSSHHDSRDSSPELALFAGTTDVSDHLGFREDGALELRSSTEELAFLEPAPGEPAAPPAPSTSTPATSAPPPPQPTDSRRHSRKDSQGSEVAALLGIAGRTSRLSSVGSQCSAQSAISHVSRLSVVSGMSRSPSPHKMLLETSFCGPKPIETDPEICAAAVEEHLLEIVQMKSQSVSLPSTTAATPPTTSAQAQITPAPDARDRREVRTEVTVEPTRHSRPAPAPAADLPAVAVTPPADDKREKETRNRARVEERRARSRERRDRSEPEVFKSKNRTKDIIRIKLKPDEEYDDNDDDDEEESERTLVDASARKPDTLALGVPRTTRAPSAPATDRIARSPSPQPPLTSRKSSFCSLFKSKETIASPDSPSDAMRRKKSLNEGRSRSRSKSRDRSAPPSSAGKLRGSVLSLFKTPRRSAAASPSPSSRAASPGPSSSVPSSVPPPPSMRGLKYYEDARDGIIHIPLHTPPDEPEGSRSEPEPRETIRPASAPISRPTPVPPKTRTVLPDGSIIIPLHSPTEREPQSQGWERAIVEPTPTVVDRYETRSAEPSVSVREPEPKLESRKASLETAVNVEASPPATDTVTPPEQPDLPSNVATPTNGAPRSRRKERLVFTTHVGSTEQVFSTQFSITKTPSVTSEISESFPSLQDEVRPTPGVLRDTHITSDPSEEGAGSLASVLSVASAGAGGRASGDVSPAGARDSSESEGSSDAGTSAAATASGAVRTADVESRVLVVQESFEEELPYVPTTLPQERSRAVPMLPVRERGSITHTTASVERPRSGTPRTRSGSGDGSSDARKTEWIDFSEVPERRKAARRIQTLPASVAGVVTGARAESPSPDEPPLSYVEPDQCRCECHRATSPSSHHHSSPDDGVASVSAAGAQVELVVVARPFTADLGVREDPPS
ncbi:reverse transcriptase (RNA-dependent DNA polymerase) domain-containing protein [Phthorimaea operculella]|nr:reverse transcriptase (RNA-dependent DNA polymerase) domain-containing protein [Phthorimaea operculella]